MFLPLIAHIETNVDGDLSLDALADVAGADVLGGRLEIVDICLPVTG